MNSSGQRRASPRTRTLLEGSIVYNNGLSRMECTVRDLSATGARLVFAQPIKIPAEFELEIPRKKIARRAQIIWYDGRDHGIMFLDREEKTTDDTSLRRITNRNPLPLGQGASSVAEILDEARQRIAQILEFPTDTIQLRVEVAR